MHNGAQWQAKFACCLYISVGCLWGWLGNCLIAVLEPTVLKLICTHLWANNIHPLLNYVGTTQSTGKGCSATVLYFCWLCLVLLEEGDYNNANTSPKVVPDSNWHSVMGRIGLSDILISVFLWHRFAAETALAHNHDHDYYLDFSLRCIIETRKLTPNI